MFRETGLPPTGRETGLYFLLSPFFGVLHNGYTTRVYTVNSGYVFLWYLRYKHHRIGSAPLREPNVPVVGKHQIISSLPPSETCIGRAS